MPTPRGGAADAGLKPPDGGCRPGKSAPDFCLPAFVEDSQVQGRPQQRPLGAHSGQSPHGPAPEAVVLLELRKTRFDGPAALFPLRADARLF